MGIKEWIIYISVTVAIFVVGAIGMLVLVPQTESRSDLNESYQGINRSEYTYRNNKQDSAIEIQYDITSSDINKALKQDKYDEGNINPFTPKKDVTIYNEPTLNPNNGSNSNTPAGK